MKFKIFPTFFSTRHLQFIIRTCKNIILRRKTYDAIVSIGPHCITASHLEHLGLRVGSYPFDWLRDLSVEKALYFIDTKFKDFLIKENLQPKEPPSCDNGLKYDLYQDKLHGIYFVHDFPKDRPFDIAFDMVKEKYDRRINRLLDRIERSKSILFLYSIWADANGKSILKLNKRELDCIQNFRRNRRGKKIDFVFISNIYEGRNKLIFIDEGIEIVEIGYNEAESHIWNLSQKNYKKAYSRFSISHRLRDLET